MRGMRGLLLLFLVGCAGTAASQEARVEDAITPTFEPATNLPSMGIPSKGKYIPVEPQGAHLEIPAEYVDQLDWSLESFRDTPALFDDQPAEPIVREAKSYRRARRAARNSRGLSRGRRYKAPRPRRLVGLSVTLTRASGHAVSRPGHAVRRPGHAISRPQHPFSRPQHPVSRPDHAVSRPNHPVTRASHPVTRPNHPVTRPQHPIGLPGHAVTRPEHPVSRPGHPVTRPGHPYNPVPRGAEQKAK